MGCLYLKIFEEKKMKASCFAAMFYFKKFLRIYKTRLREFIKPKNLKKIFLQQKNFYNLTSIYVKRFGSEIFIFGDKNLLNK